MPWLNVCILVCQYLLGNTFGLVFVNEPNTEISDIDFEMMMSVSPALSSHHCQHFLL